MTNDPLSPQKIIDDAANALTSTPSVESVPNTPTAADDTADQKNTASYTPDVSTSGMMTTSVEETPSQEINTTPLPIPDEAPVPPPPQETLIVPPANAKKGSDDNDSIIPPLPGDGKKQSKPKKNGNKGILIAGILVLILTLPVAIYYITQSPQFAEIRSRASGGAYPSITVTKTPTPTGRSAEGTHNGCSYLNNRDTSREQNQLGASCSSTNCGGDCGKFTYNCGHYCYDSSCGGSACTEPTDVPATATTAPTTTSEPTSTTAPTTTDAPTSTTAPTATPTTGGTTTYVTATPTTYVSGGTVIATPTTQAIPVTGVGPGTIGILSVTGSILLLILGLAL